MKALYAFLIAICLFSCQPKQFASFQHSQAEQFVNINPMADPIEAIETKPVLQVNLGSTEINTPTISNINESKSELKSEIRKTKINKRALMLTVKTIKKLNKIANKSEGKIFENIEEKKPNNFLTWLIVSFLLTIAGVLIFLFSVELSALGGIFVLLSFVSTILGISSAVKESKNTTPAKSPLGKILLALLGQLLSLIVGAVIFFSLFNWGG
jgi:hypothetical protein